MKKLIIALLIATVGCTSTETQLQQALKKNPKILFEVIKENPQEFIEVVNIAAQSAQQKSYEMQVAEREKKLEENLKNPKKPQLDPERRLSGNESGKIVLVEFADFQCPACKMGHTELKKFKAKYKDQVQFYYKNLPLDFHEMAYPAAQYFEAVRLQDSVKAQKFYDHLFENQNALSVEFLKKAVKHVGGDLKKVEKDILSAKVKANIEEDMAEAQKFGLTGTPVVIVNGVVLFGAQKFEELERVLNLTLTKREI